MMTGVYVSVASSIKPHQHIPSALAQLAGVARITGCSRFYRTPAIGRPNDPPFVNGVVRLDTRRPPHALRRALRRIEESEGRIRTEDSFGPRTLDLDLLLWHDVRTHDAEMQLPAADLQTRRWLAVGVLELEPGLRLPDGHGLRDPGGPPLMEEPGLRPSSPVTVQTSAPAATA